MKIGSTLHGDKKYEGDSPIVWPTAVVFQPLLTFNDKIIAHQAHETRKIVLSYIDIDIYSYQVYYINIDSSTTARSTGFCFYTQEQARASAYRGSLLKTR